MLYQFPVSLIAGGAFVKQFWPIRCKRKFAKQIWESIAFPLKETKQLMSLFPSLFFLPKMGM